MELITPWKDIWIWLCSLDLTAFDPQFLPSGTALEIMLAQSGQYSARDGGGRGKMGNDIGEKKRRKDIRKWDEQ